MGSGNFYVQSANNVKNVRKSRFLRSFLFAGILLMSMPFIGKAQTAPTFVLGSATTITVCQNSPAFDIGSYLGVNDPDPGGQILTWSVTTFPGQGSVVGSHVDLSTGGTVTPPPGTLSYTPNPGYIGPDMFVIQITDGVDGSNTITVNVVVTALPSLVIDAIPAVCAGATSTTISYSSLSMVGPTSTIFVHQPNSQPWIVPPGVTSINFDVQGAVGGGDSYSGMPNPGNGARITGDLTVAPGMALEIYAGGAGANGSTSGALGGWNGGGNATFYFFGCGGAGGGASDIRIGGNALSNRVVVAGGGGGNGWDAPGPGFGGCGGGLIGGSGSNNVGGSHAGGGTQLTGGAGSPYLGWTSGANGSLGMGGAGSPQGISGGGGGGYYGGGGGIWNGGGGGSSYADGSLTSSVTHTPCYNIGNGVVAFNYNIPGTYTIIWQAAAQLEGFVDVTAATLPSSPITVAVPPAATPSTYYGTLYIANSTCTSNGYPISITINPIPDVAPSANQVLCNNDPSAPVFFSGAVPGTAYNWTNDMPSIGLAASGTGDIGSFTATNTSSSPVIATITVTPVANGCSGTPVSFSITVNPTPMLSTTLTPPDVCDSAIFNYTPMSATTGTTFTWFRNPITDIANLGASGAGNPAEYLDNTSPNPVTVPYMYVLAANSCLNTQFVNVVVNPTPSLSSPLNAGAICNHGLFSYTPTSFTAGTVFTWNRNITPGISNTSATGTGDPSENLHNTTNAPVVVSYTYTMYTMSSPCSNTQVVTVTVNPTPSLNTSLSPTAICNNTMFSYGPGSATTGTTFSWTRGAITGIGNLPNAGVDSINEILINTTPNPVTATYTYTMMANGCSNSQNVNVVVYPKPMLSSATSPVVCDSTVFNYPPTSLTSGTTFTWTRAAVLGISNLAAAGTGNPNETLLNTTPAPVIVTYVYTMMANGCSNIQNVNLTVNPKPELSSSLTPPAICDSNTFSYNPTSNTAGSSYAWYRPYIPGIYAVASSGTGNPNQQLINSTYVVVDVMYVYTVTANGCSNEQNVVVRVNPTPKLNPPFTATVCSGSPFTYTPTSYTPGALYTWNRPLTPGITPPTAFMPLGNGKINETVYNAGLTPIFVDYIYRLSVNGCTNLVTQTVKVKVNPTPPMPSIITYPPSNLCAGTMFQNFGAGGLGEGLEYTWSATNAEVFATGTNNQYALVNFHTPGTSVVTITSNVNGYNCTISNSFTVNVSSSTSQVPEVIYFNGQFICLKNDNTTYQWGYDDAFSLDSTILTGEIDQNYNNSNPDWSTKRYWVITKNNDGCWQKAYYNAPTGITNINADEAALKVYPNPANEIVNVEINSMTGGNYKVEIMNMLGQKLDVQTLVNRKASFNVAALPAGAYLVDCYLNGTKVAATRFIKN